MLINHEAAGSWISLQHADRITDSNSVEVITREVQTVSISQGKKVIGTVGVR